MHFIHTASVVVSIVLPLLGSTPPEPPRTTSEEQTPSPCSIWALHGYRVGMTQDEASTVRPFKPLPRMMRRALKESSGEMSVFQVEEKKRFEGMLYFTKDGTLQTYVATIPFDLKSFADPQSLKLALRNRLGEPVEDDPYRSHFAGTGVDAHGHLQYTAWLSEECDAYLVLTEAQFQGLPNPIITLTLTGISVITEGTKVRAEKAEELLE